MNCTVLVRIHELARNEFDDAIEWYEIQSKQLGKRFRNTVISKINQIRKNPTWSLIEQDYIYKVYVPRFPYKILYSIENEKQIVIWVIAHLHRKPWYWSNRLS